MEDQFTRGRCCVDGAVADGTKTNALILQVVNEGDQVANRASKSVEPPDEQNVARLKL